MEMGAKEKNQQLYKPCNGKQVPFEIFLTHNCSITVTITSNACLLFVLIGGIIAKKPPTSLQQDLQELRGSASCPRSEPQFEMADIFFFCRRGVESILDDEVTKRFSSQELDSWNLLTRSNYNVRHISLRLTVIWGLGVLVRYGVLLPLRSDHSQVMGSRE